MCERPIGAGELHYRFAIALEGEQRLLGDAGPHAGEELAALVKRLEEGPEDPTAWEEQVHWERSGVVCATCRARLVELLGGGAAPAH